MPKVLDLFCGLGGASVGYARAGFEVHGVDLNPQPDYPFKFWQADALEFLEHIWRWGGQGPYDLVHASPPCAAYTAIEKGTNGSRGNHPRLTEPVRDLLNEIGVPYVIENPAARPDIVLCGEMFGLGVLRHRKFELGGWSMAQPVHKPHRGRARGWRHGEYFDGPYVAVYGTGARGDRRPSRGPGGGKANIDEAREAMGVDWSFDLCGVTQAIPPAYTECIGRAFIDQLEGTARAA